MVIAMKKNGFTLLELLVTVAVAAIVLTIGVPSFKAVIENNRRVSAVNDFLAALTLTRSEAIKKNRRVTLCKSNDQTSCSTATAYNKGWIIFEDAGATAIGSIDSDDGTSPIIKVFEGFPNSVTITASTDVANFVSYLPNGRVDKSGITCSGEGGCTFTIKVADKDKEISLSRTGRAQAK